MAMTDYFTKAVSVGNVRGVRIMMKDSLLVDPTFAEFNEMKAFTDNMADLYDVHDGCELKDKSSGWDNDYMNDLMVQVVDNFSRKRVEHLKEVVKYLRPVVARSKTAPATSPASGKNDADREKSDSQRWTSEPKYQEHKRQDKHNNKMVRIAGGSMAGGVVGGIIAGLVGGSVAVGVVTGAVVVGVTAAIATK